jgi:ABC-type nitrate/sulfonate/bicarbonate transport system permease component
MAIMAGVVAGLLLSSSSSLYCFVAHLIIFAKPIAKLCLLQPRFTKAWFIFCIKKAPPKDASLL